jgi:hypothetical protein
MKNLTIDSVSVASAVVCEFKIMLRRSTCIHSPSSQSIISTVSFFQSKTSDINEDAR